MKTKTHFYIPAVSSIAAGKTACGIEAWEESNTEFEASLSSGGRIDITRRVRDITCEKCAKSNPKQL